MTQDHVAARTLVKSPPELWAECSDPESLARHLSGCFGEIRITRLDPETSVAWEGEHAHGTVQIEPSGWGTRVTLTAETTVENDLVEEEADAEVEEAVAPPDHDVAADAGRARGRWRRLIGRTRAWFTPVPAEVEPPPTQLVEEPPVEDPALEPTPDPPPDAPDPSAILAAALDSLGQAHHRPFSRA